MMAIVQVGYDVGWHMQAFNFSSSFFSRPPHKYSHTFVWSDLVRGCMMHTECAKMAAVSCGTSRVNGVKYTTSVDIQKHTIKS